MDTQRERRFNDILNQKLSAIANSPRSKGWGEGAKKGGGKGWKKFVFISFRFCNTLSILSHFISPPLPPSEEPNQKNSTSRTKMENTTPMQSLFFASPSVTSPKFSAKFRSFWDQERLWIMHRFWFVGEGEIIIIVIIF